MTDPLQQMVRSGWIVRHPSQKYEPSYLRRLIDRREMLFFLAWRDIKLKNKQMLLGTAWTVLQPVTQMLLFTIVLGRFAGLPSEAGLPYSVLVFSALIPWQYFSTSVTRSASSLVMNDSLLTKVAFPRLVLPAASVLPGVIDVIAAGGVLAAMMMWFHITPKWTIVFLPVFLFLTLVTSLAAGVWLSTLSARYRDVRYILPFILQAWMLATPIGYTVGIVPSGRIRQIYELNPLAVIVRGVRWCLFGTAPLEWMHLLSAGVVAVALLLGVKYFRVVEDTLADVI